MGLTATNFKQLALGAATPNAPGTSQLGGATNTLVGLKMFATALFDVKLPAGPTGGTLDLYIQSSIDSGATWFDVAHLPQQAAAGAAIRYVFSLTRGYRTAAAPSVVNTADATPTLPVNTVLPDMLGDSLRAVVTLGAGTSAGSTPVINVLMSQ